eukprot:1694488-Rhodomonas_salina.5
MVSKGKSGWVLASVTFSRPWLGRAAEFSDRLEYICLERRAAARLMDDSCCHCLHPRRLRTH